MQPFWGSGCFCACFGVALRRTGGGLTPPLLLDLCFAFSSHSQSPFTFAVILRRPLELGRASSCMTRTQLPCPNLGIHSYLSRRTEYGALEPLHSRRWVELARYLPNWQVARKKLVWAEQGSLLNKERKRGNKGKVAALVISRWAPRCCRCAPPYRVRGCKDGQYGRIHGH